MNAQLGALHPAGLTQLVEWWLHDSAFRVEVGGDVAGAALRRGARLTAAEWTLLRGLGDFLVADEAPLAPRGLPATSAAGPMTRSGDALDVAR